MCGDQFNKCVWGLNAIVTHEENVTNTLKWRVAEVGTAQSRREATTGDYRKHPHTRRTIREPFFTSGYIENMDQLFIDNIVVKQVESFKFILSTISIDLS